MERRLPQVKKRSDGPQRRPSEKFVLHMGYRCYPDRSTIGRGGTAYCFGKGNHPEAEGQNRSCGKEGTSRQQPKSQAPFAESRAEAVAVA